MITYRASNWECWNSLQSRSSLHHILNVVVVGWGSIRSCRSLLENRINTVQMLSLCAAAVERRAPVRRDSRVSLWQRLLHLPPLRWLMSNDLHVFRHSHTRRPGTGPHAAAEQTQACMHAVQEGGQCRNHEGYFTFLAVTKSFTLLCTTETKVNFTAWWSVEHRL